jgi:hypothetical protein
MVAQGVNFLARAPRNSSAAMRALSASSTKRRLRSSSALRFLAAFFFFSISARIAFFSSAVIVMVFIRFSNVAFDLPPHGMKGQSGAVNVGRRAPARQALREPSPMQRPPRTQQAPHVRRIFAQS